MSREYICDVCGKREPWSASWQWWGSYLDLDEGAVVHTCSDECRTTLDAVKLTKLRKTVYASIRVRPPADTKQNLIDRQTGADMRVITDDDKQRTEP